MLLFHFSVFFVSLLALFWSADKMLTTAIVISEHYNISPFVIGIVVIGFATSSPELAVSALAAWENQMEIAVGNVFGSNIANLLLVFGSAALLAAIGTEKNILRYMFPLLVASALLPGVLLWDNLLDRWDGIILMIALIAVLRVMVLKTPQTSEASRSEHADGIRKSLLWLIIGFIVLVGASEFTVRSAVAIAEQLGISKLVIGLTIIALGTSLPEVVTAVVGAYRRQHSIVVGNILGSNVFNSLAVLGAAGLARPAIVPDVVLSRDFVVMVGATLLLWGIFGTRKRLTRGGGVFLLSCFIAYIIYLYVTNSP